MKQPQISVIVPVYNAERTIDRCIGSILNSTLEDIEVICINDGSTDYSYKKMKGWSVKDSRVICLDKPNGGVSSARNLGLRSARGKYIAFVDSDDYVAPNIYSSLLSTLLQNDADCACCQVKDVLVNKTKASNHVFGKSVTGGGNSNTKYDKCC